MAVAVRPVGVEGEMVSGVVVATLFTVTVMLAEVVWLPAASLAVAVMEWEPFVERVVLKTVEYGETVSSVPRFVPSSLNCTPATPTLSEAEAERVTVLETIAPDAGAVRDTVGGVVSGMGGVEVPEVHVISSTHHIAPRSDIKSIRFARNPAGKLKEERGSTI